MGRLIGPDAWLVSGVNVERLESAPIAKWQPSEETWLPSSFDSILAGRTRQIFHVELGKEGESQFLDIHLGNFVLERSKPEFQEFATTAHRGVQVVTSEHGVSIALLDPGIIVSGNEIAILEAIDRWKQGGARTEIHDKVHSLAERYDAWIVLVEPLKHIHVRHPMVASTQVEQLLQLVEEVRAGARFGGATQVNVDAQMATSAEATAVAAIARWLPNWLAWQAPGRFESALIAAIEGFSVHANGRTASLSFTLPDDKVKEILEERANAAGR